MTVFWILVSAMSMAVIPLLLTLLLEYMEKKKGSR